MKAVEWKKLRKELEKELDSRRYEHTLGVEFTSASLAMCFGVPVQSARIAGLLHDCAKCLGDEKSISLCEKYDVPVSEYERRNPSLLHSKLGSVLAKVKYDVSDTDILNAIANHTTGRPGMSILEKIVFIADYIEPGRDKAANLSEIRQLSFIDLDQAMVRILEDTIAYLNSTGEEMDPQTLKTYAYYKNLIQFKK